MKDFRRTAYMEGILNQAQNYKQSCGSSVLIAEHILYVMLKEVLQQPQRLPEDQKDHHEWSRMTQLLPDHAQELEDLQKKMDRQAHQKKGGFMDVLTLDKMIDQAVRECGGEAVSADILFRVMMREMSGLPDGKGSREQNTPRVHFGGTVSEPQTEEPAGSGKPPVQTEDVHEETDVRSEDPKEELIPLLNNEKSLQTALREKVLGQDWAIRVLTEGYFRGEFLALTDPGRFRPRASFLFAGPPGVGKTFLAQSTAELLGIPFKIFDMSGYSDPNAFLELTGLSKGYQMPKPGALTNFVKEHPRCILLFDEIEKANLTVIQLFLQILDGGRLRDNFYEENIPFKDSIVIFTTNAGRSLYETSDSGDFSGMPRKVILKAIGQDLDPATRRPLLPAAICSRFDSGNVVMFNRMSVNILMDIARKEILRQAGNVEKATGWKASIEDGVLASILFAEGGRADARTLRARGESFYVDELYELMRLMPPEKISALKEIRFRAELPKDPGIRSLFEVEDIPQVLVFARQDCCRAIAAASPEVTCLGAESFHEAIGILKKQDIMLVLCDLTEGIRQSEISYLNIEDVDSEGREFFWYLRERMPGLPVYLLETGSYEYRQAEKVSLLGQGARDFLTIPKEGEGSELAAVCRALRLEQSMRSLASANRVLQYGTAQELSEDGHSAVICLTDYRMKVAADPKDMKNVLGDVSRPDLTLDDVIGVEDAKGALRSFVDYLKNPKKYMEMGIESPQGVLLYGPPGTGKTLMAKALAGESGVTFVAAEGNAFLKKYVGEGPDMVHELFRTARRYAPSILFIDEIDAIALDRAGNMLPGRGEALTALLTEMDGFHTDVTKPVFVLAATNAPIEGNVVRRLDPALLRRFDRPIYVALPDREARKEYIIRQCEQNSRFRISEAQIDSLAARSVSMSLSDLAKIFNAAPMEAIKAGKEFITDEILDEVFEKQRSGGVRQWNPDELLRTARHEAGHTLMQVLAGRAPSYVTVVARGEHGGYMASDVDEHKGSYTKRELQERIRVALGGRAAEIVCYGEDEGISTGASGDLSQATEIVRRMLCCYGMDAEYGMASLESSRLSPAEAEALARRTNAILAEELKEAVSRIRENRSILDALADRLMKQDYLRKTDIEEICRTAGGH